RRRAEYDYKLAQFEYHYKRRMIARKILDGDSRTSCTIPMDELVDHFNSVFEQSNECTLAPYDPAQVVHADDFYPIDDVRAAISKIKIDTSAGSDRVLMKTVKDLNIAGILHRITSIMLTTSYVPSGLSEGRTVLISKGGDPCDPKNWRPICIYSVLRRIIE